MSFRLRCFIGSYNVTEAYEGISKLVDEKSTNPVNIIQGLATNLSRSQIKVLLPLSSILHMQIMFESLELADFFYVWLKRTIGDQHPEWFSTYLCDHSDELS